MHDVKYFVKNTAIAFIQFTNPEVH